MGGILASLSPWILLTVSVTTIGSFLLMRQNSDWAYRNKGRWLGADRRLAYVRDRSADFSQAKDLRLYGMSGWLRSLFDQALTDRMGWHKKQQQVGFFTDGGQTLIAFVRESISYGGLIRAIYAKGMSAADFVLYFGVIEGLSNWLFQLARNLDQLYRSHLGFCEIREFLDLTPGDPAGEASPSRRAFLHRIPPCQLPLRRQRGGHHPRPELCDPQRGKTGDCRSQRRGKDHACKTDLRFLHPFCRLRFHRRHRYPAIWAQSVLQAFFRCVPGNFSAARISGLQRLRPAG